MTVELDIYEALVRRSLERGVPAPVVAEVFELPLDSCKQLKAQLMVQRFNTDDQAEYLEHIQWETLERVEQMIRNGTPDQAARIATAVFGKQIAAAGRRPSSALEEQRQKMTDLFAGIRDAPAKAGAPGRFVVGNVGTDRRANRVDDDEDE